MHGRTGGTAMKFERILLIIIAAIVSFQFIHTIRNDINFDDITGNTPKPTVDHIKTASDDIETLIIALSKEFRLTHKIRSGSAEYSHLTEDDLTQSRQNTDTQIEQYLATMKILNTGAEPFVYSRSDTGLNDYQRERYSIDHIMNLENNIVEPRELFSEYYEVTKKLLDMMHYLAHQIADPQERATILLKQTFLESAVTTTQSFPWIYAKQFLSASNRYYRTELFDSISRQSATYAAYMHRYGTIIGFDEKQFRELESIRTQIDDERDELFFELSLLMENITGNNEAPETEDIESGLNTVFRYSDSVFDYDVLQIPEYFAALGLD